MAHRLLLLGAIAVLAAAIGGPQRALAESKGPQHLIAPPIVCKYQNDVGAPAWAQQQAMRCMTNFARRSMKRIRLSSAASLSRAAKSKSIDILRCDSFSHSACGRSSTFWLRVHGYTSAPCWKASENLAWGADRTATVRLIFRTWMRSPAHRHNILSPEYRQLGVSLRIGTLAGRSGAHIWTQHFGSRCKSAARSRR